MGTIDARSVAILRSDQAHKKAVAAGLIKYNRFRVIINGQDYTKHVVFPIKWSRLLDERLDEVRLSMKYCTEHIFTPLTPVTIKAIDKKDKEQNFTFIVSTDDATELPVGSGRFNHEVMLIEQTKLLEGIVVDALTFTNDLGRVYTSNPKTAQPIYS